MIRFRIPHPIPAAFKFRLAFDLSIRPGVVIVTSGTLGICQDSSKMSEMPSDVIENARQDLSRSAHGRATLTF